MNYSNQDGPTPEDQELPAIKNLAKDLKEDQLLKIAEECYTGYNVDYATFKPWRDCADMWIKLATQAMERKSFPWPNASNIKYPLVSVAALQFSARAYPTLVPSDGQIVKPVVIGNDPTGNKLKRAQRVAKFMSYQIKEMPSWEEDFDRMLIITAVIGTAFKKVYYNAYKECPDICYVDARNIVVNYFADSIETAERVSEHFFLYERELKEYQKMGLYLDVDLGPPTAASYDDLDKDVDGRALPYFLINQHTWLDLDEDGIKEPYIVTFHKDTQKILKIVPRFNSKTIKMLDGKIVKIDAYDYFVKYGFIPNPESKIYDLGFGHMLGPINESVNTIVNQLVDAGTLANLQGGFIGKGLRMKMGNMPIQAGEWKAVNATGDDIKKQIFPLPFKEPSDTLFQLLGTLITSGKELASVAEIFVGKMPGQNTPATTTMATIEQGMKVFTAIYKRIYRSLKKEFYLLYKLNETYIDPETEAEVLDEPISAGDFAQEGKDICPGADPTAVSTTERLLKAQGLMELMAAFPGFLKPDQVLMRILEAQEQPNIEQLLPGMAETGQLQPTPPPPDPKVMEIQMKGEAEAQKSAMKQKEIDHKIAADERKNAQDLEFKKQEHQADLQFKGISNQLDAEAAQHATRMKMRDAEVGSQAKEIGHVQKLRHNEEMAKSKEKTSKTGGKAPQRGSSSK